MSQPATSLDRNGEAGAKAGCHDDGVEFLLGSSGEMHRVSVIALDAAARDQPPMAERLQDAGIHRWVLLERPVGGSRQTVVLPPTYRPPARADRGMGRGACRPRSA